MAQTKSKQESLTPEGAYKILVDGNNRFLRNAQQSQDLTDQVAETSAGQYPFAVVLSCIDSRVPVELVFDQGIGDLFSVRVAGNIVNGDILGSIEYACKVAGSKLVVVLGHTKCGAVTAACSGVELGNITPLLAKMRPAIEAVDQGKADPEDDRVERVAIQNVQLSINSIREESAILSELEQSGKIKIRGAMYSVDTGRVVFF